MAFKNNEKERVSLIAFLSVIGLAGFLILTLLGEIFLQGGEITKAALFTIGFTLVFVVILIGLVKVKGAKDNFRVWKLVEYTVLVLYIGMAVLLSRPTIQFFSINANKDEIKEVAAEDFGIIRNIFTDYENFEQDAIANTRRGILNSIGGTRSSELNSFYSSMKINPRDNDNVGMFCDIQKEKILGKAYKTYKESNNDILDNWLAAVDNWNVLRIPGIAKSSYVAEDITKSLIDCSKKADLPVIKQTGNQYGIVSQKQPFAYEVPQLGLESYLQKVQIGGLAISIILLCICHLLILLSYFFGFRDPKSGWRSVVNDNTNEEDIL